MRYLRRNRQRSVGALVVVAAAAGLLLFVVLPALASTVGSSVPPASSPGGVTPTLFSIRDQEGQENDCKNFYSSGGPTNSFVIKDGKTGTYTDKATGATFTLTVDPGNPGNSWPAYASGKYFSFTSTGAAIVDVGVDGANERDATRYRYSSLAAGFVTSDGYLHASAVKTNSSGIPTSLDGLDDMAFCYNVAGSASGTVFNDANHNGVKDSGDGGLPSRTIDLYKGGSKVGSTTSDANGLYSFTTLTPGNTYTVCIVGQAGQAQTLPVTATTGSAVCSGPGENGVGYTFTTSQNVKNLNFGLASQATISGTAFVDNNGDGANNGSDSPAGNLTATLYNGSGTSLGTMQTDAQTGSISFPNQFVNDTYTVCISSPSGQSTQTLPSSGGGCTAQGTNGYTFVLAAGGKTDANFGFEPYGAVSGTVYNDANQNATIDAGEAQPGWKVNLYAGSSLVQSKTSGTDGSYSFALPLSPGTNYTVCEAPPSGTWAQTEPNPASGNLCTGSTELPKGYAFTPLTTGETHSGNDFGNAQAATCGTGGVAGSGDSVFECKPGHTYSFNSGTLSNGLPFVSVFAGDQSGGAATNQPTIEKVTLPDPVGADGQVQFTHLQYTDTFTGTGYSLSDLHPMPYCLVDPSGGPSDPSGWGSGFPNSTTQVLPAGATSCSITITTGLDATNNGYLQAYIYTEIDGLKAGL